MCRQKTMSDKERKYYVEYKNYSIRRLLNQQRFLISFYRTSIFDLLADKNELYSTIDEIEVINLFIGRKLDLLEAQHEKGKD